MITVDVIYDDSNIRRGFVVSGHAEYANPGEDIVCAGVSALTFTTLNALDALVNADMDVNMDEDDNSISCIFNGTIDEKSNLLIDAMLMGLKDIESNYGNKFLTVNVQEVEKWWN